MSWKLDLLRDGLNAARACARRGQRKTAVSQLRSILRRSDLPDSLAFEAHKLAAELAIANEQFAQSRRYLREAAKLEPNNAQIHYLAGLCFERDPYADDLRAAVHFRKAMRIEESNSLYQAAFGRAAVRCGKLKLGLKALKAAANRASADLEVIRIVVDGLIEAGHPNVARTIALKARFLRPECAEFRIHSERARFAIARLEQEQAGRRQDAKFAKEGDVPLLPFLKLAATKKIQEDLGDSFTRRDVLSMPRPHFPRFRLTRADC